MSPSHQLVQLLTIALKANAEYLNILISAMFHNVCRIWVMLQGRVLQMQSKERFGPCPKDHMLERSVLLTPAVWPEKDIFDIVMALLIIASSDFLTVLCYAPRQTLNLSWNCSLLVQNSCWFKLLFWLGNVIFFQYHWAFWLVLSHNRRVSCAKWLAVERFCNRWCQGVKWVDAPHPRGHIPN